MSKLIGVIVLGDSISGQLESFTWKGLGFVPPFNDQRTGQFYSAKNLPRVVIQTPRAVVANMGRAGLSLLGSGQLTEISPWWWRPLMAPPPTMFVNTGLPPNRPVREYLAALMIGSNPSTSDPAQHAVDVAVFCATEKAAAAAKGIRLEFMLTTLPSRTDGNLNDFDTSYQQPYNAIVRQAGWAEDNGFIRICDLASAPELGAVGAANSTTYFQDKVHLTDAGGEVGGAIWIIDLIAALNAMQA